MSFGSWLAGIFNPSGQRRANQANDDLSTVLSPNSPYWQASQLQGDQGIMQGAAGLENANIGYDSSNLDSDSAALGQLGDTFGDIQQNGGKLTQAVTHQAQADVANTTAPNLKAVNRQAAGNVIDTDNAERNWAAGSKTQTRAQILGNMLKKQTWDMAVNQANFEAAQAGRGIQNQDTNLAQQLALTMNEGANSARNAQRGISDDFNQAQFNNAMAAVQMGVSAASSVASGIAGMGSAAQSVSGAGGAANSAVNSGYASSAPTYTGGTGTSAGYAMPGVATGSAMNGSGMGVSRIAQSSKLATQLASNDESYVNPISGSTVNANYPSDVASWGSWLTDGSSLVT